MRASASRRARRRRRPSRSRRRAPRSSRTSACPSAWVRTPSQIVRATSSAGHVTIRPSRSDACASAASSGSTPTTRTSGRSALTAVATPEISPPPPTQTTTVAASGRSATISSPTVPCPAMMRGSSNGGMYSSPRSSRISAAARRRCSLELPQRTISAPQRGGALDLDRRGVLRHHDRCRDAEERGGRGDSLGVIPARVRDDARGDPLPWASRRER